MEYIKDLVSIVMPTYKRSDKLLRAIDSVLAQTYSKIELLLVNDNIPGDEYYNSVEQKINKYKKDKRFRYITQEKHINGAVARNVGIRQAKGEYIAFLDDDDWWELSKIEKQLLELKQLDSSWGGVSCKFRFFDENNNIIGKTSKYKDGNIYKEILYMFTDVATGTLLLRRSALDDAGYFDENLLRNQDVQLLAFFTYKYKLKEVDKYLHCVDASDAQNRFVDEKVMLKNRDIFFKSVKPIINTLTQSEYKCMICMRNIELGYVLFLNRHKIKGIKYMLYALKSPKAIYYATLKFYNMIRMKL